MLFSKKTLGFYHPELVYNDLPDDVIEITEEEHEALMNGQSAGMVIVVDDKSNKPVLEVPVMTNEAKATIIRGYASNALNEFAKTKHYESTDDAISYLSSKNKTSVADAKKIVDARDDYRDTVLALIDKIEAVDIERLSKDFKLLSW